MSSAFFNNGINIGGILIAGVLLLYLVFALVVVRKFPT